MMLKIATWNIGTLYADLTNNLPLFKRALSVHKPQVLFLQEFVPIDELEEAILQSSGLKRLHYMEYSASHIATGKSMGVAVFGKGEACSISAHKLLKPDRTFEYKGVQERFHDKYFYAVDIRYENDCVYKFITGHGYSFHRYSIDPVEYKYIFDDLEMWLQQTATKDTIVIGDFNLAEPNKVLPWLCGNYRDVFANCFTRPMGRKSDCLFLPKCYGHKDTVNEVCFDNSTSTGLDHNYLQTTIFKR